jgi:anaerobic magnesium-protoporphyrin IX monomethyl ester cyclase
VSTQRPTRILFINTVSEQMESQTRYPSLGLGYLVSMLRQEFGSRLDILLVEKDAAATIERWQPDVLALSSVSVNFNQAKRYAQLGHDRGIPVIVGGYHITELPSCLEPTMDVGVIGEGEKTICDLMEIYLATGELPPDRLRWVQGIVYWDSGERVETEPREVIGKKVKRLDEIPMPARDMLDVRPHTNMLTSRGCPYKCTFCASTKFWPSMRYFSPEYMVEEIKYLVKNHGVRWITFHDDLFIANRKRVHAFHELVMREGFPKQGIRFSCESSATLITDDMARMLKEMNFVTVFMGLESGNQEVLTRLKGPAFSVEKNRQAVEALHRNGIHAHACFVIGEPQETLEQMEDTYQFIRSLPLSYVNTLVLTPLPGTPLWHNAKTRGLVSDDMDWDRLSLQFDRDWEKVVLLSEQVSREELHKMFYRIHRLCLWKTLKTLPWHPLRGQAIEYGLAKIAESLHAVGKRYGLTTLGRSATQRP